MKIVHISTSSKGGAGIAAFRLHKALLDQGFDSNMLVMNEKTNLEKKLWGLDSFPKKYSFLRKLKFYVLRKFHSITIRNLDKTTEIFTSPFSKIKVEDHPLIKEATIIHLHWISNFVNISSFFKSISKTDKKIVWTFHDMNPFMGGFHYEGDQARNKRVKLIEKYYLAIKVKAYNRLKPNQLHIIYLCNWMKEKSDKREVFKKISFSIVPNIYEAPQVTSQRPPSVKDKFVFMTSAQSLDAHRKGMDLFFAALEDVKLQASIQIEIILAGKMSSPIPQNLKEKYNFNILGHLSIEELQRYYELADYFVIPSREDNLPNVMLESFAAGTPVISFSNGGMREYIKHMDIGVTVEKIDKNELTKTLSMVIGKGRKSPNIIKDHFHKYFKRDKILDKIHKVYKD